MDKILNKINEYSSFSSLTHYREQTNPLFTTCNLIGVLNFNKSELDYLVKASDLNALNYNCESFIQLLIEYPHLIKFFNDNTIIYSIKNSNLHHIDQQGLFPLASVFYHISQGNTHLLKFVSEFVDNTNLNFRDNDNWAAVNYVLLYNITEEVIGPERMKKIKQSVLNFTAEEIESFNQHDYYEELIQLYNKEWNDCLKIKTPSKVKVIKI